MTNFLKIYRYILYVLAAVPIIRIYLDGMENDYNPEAYTIILLVNIYMLLCSRKNFMMLMITLVIGYCNYSIIYVNYIHILNGTLYTIHLTEDAFCKNFNVLALCNCALFYTFPFWKIPPMNMKNIFIDPELKDGRVLFVLTILLVIVFFVGFKTPELSGNRGKPRPVYEYAVSMFIIYFYYSGKLRSYMILGMIMVAFYALQNFIFGGRIYGLQFLLAAYIMLFMDKIPMKWVITGMLGFFVLFSIIGAVRGAIMSGNFSVAGILENLSNKGFALDTAYSAYYTAQCDIYVVDSWRVSDDERFSYFIDFVKSIFLGESANRSSVIQNISRRYVHHNGGGVLPQHFYFFFGPLGSFIPAFILPVYFRFIQNLKESTNGWVKCVSVFVVCHAFRWYLYSPLGLFRGVLFLTIVYYGCFVIHHYIPKLSARRIG